ncbi:hypothetical protein DCCM_2579 [Desulfocucumis palustris]|uniref:Uncharacterized protein n=1 Tax=Desulfocucumis palustris TaxID=1898651 RepID=A0A2L2XB15_9FIRM|nr:tetratricopeptide repeat protein [Desulfocucumis palustris]GBF33477.1 hypothetical protein DCCM_2579 [Desulfocucumis palustris]
MKYSGMSRREKRKFRQRILLGAVAAVLSVGLLASSLALPVSNLFSGDPAASQSQAQTEPEQPAAAELEKKVKENPKDPALLAQLAEAYMREENREKAAENYEKVLSIKPGESSVRMNLALTYFLMDNNDKAIEHLQYEIKNNPGNNEAHYYLGQVLAYGKNDFKGGAQELQKFVDLAKTGENVAKAKQMLEEWQVRTEKK